MPMALKSGEARKPHAVCVPAPHQGHINPMLKLAKLLHHCGFHITFVHTEFNYARLTRLPGSSLGLGDLPGFTFQTIPDGLPPSAPRATPQELSSLGESMDKHCPDALRSLISRLCDGSDPDVPPVSCVVSDATMSFTLCVTEELGIPNAFLWVMGACSLLASLHFPQLIDKGIIPLKDESHLTNGYLDMSVEQMTGLQNLRLRDLPTFIRTTDRNDISLLFCLREIGRASKASAIILNTFEQFEKNALNDLSKMLPRIYPIGPLNMLLSDELQTGIDHPREVNHNFWEEDMECLQWLDSKEPYSVVYVNFGSIATVTSEQLVEFAWGLANSNQNFLWVTRPDLVAGGSAMTLPIEFEAETKDRGLVTSWVPQEAVLRHPSIGGFLNHCGWNSILEDISNGVPMLCWPFGADNPTNCRYCCTEWGIGMEVDSNVKRHEVEMMVRELISGEKGRTMRDNAAEWKRLAQEAVDPGGSSRLNFDRMIREVLEPLESLTRFEN